MGCDAGCEVVQPKPGEAAPEAERLKLEYFEDGHGRAEPIRFLLQHAGVPYEDALLTQDEWLERK